MNANGTPRRVLAVRVGRMGDMVMLTPALRLLLDGLPGTEVHLLTTAEGRRTLRGFDPRLTTFHLYHRRFLSGLIERAALRRTLRSLGFARVYLFESNPFYRKLTRGVATEVHGFDPASRTAHYSARCLEVVAPTLQRARAAGPLTLPVSAEGRAAAAAYLERHGIGASDVPVGLHLTFSESGRGLFASSRGRRHREWPLESCAALARMLAEEGGRSGVPIRPVIDVLPEERAMAETLRERSGGVLTVLSGRPDFERYKGLLASLRLLITPNTGPMHVAAAVGTPVVALFSGWSPEDCGPFVPAERAIVLRAEETATPERGLAALAAEQVFAASRPWLTAGQAPATAKRG